MSDQVRQTVVKMRPDNRAQHPMGRPSTASLVELSIMAVAYLFAMIAPALIVTPSADSAPGIRIGLAAGSTLFGALVAVVVAGLAYRRTRNYSWLVIAVVPAVTLLACAAVMAGSKAGG